MTCKRPGCTGAVVTRPRGRVREYCSDRCRIAVAQGRRLCARPGCQGVVRKSASKATRFCSTTCGSKSGNGWMAANGAGHGQFLTPKPAPSSGGSWWTNADTFYSEARKRHPETGTPLVDRGKAFVGGTEGPSLKTKMNQARAAR